MLKSACSVILATFLCGAAAAQEKEAEAKPTAGSLVAAARDQIGKTISYDPAYVTLKYPGGDVPIEKGVCTDVVIRAMRKCGVDLQQTVHEDMAKNFSKYPKLWGLKKTDRNIDHRRVPNLDRFFERQGKSVPVSKDPKDYQPGDFVVCRLSNGLIHIMIVSNKSNSEGIPLVIHNIGGGAQEEDRLFEFKIEGHHRWYR